MPVDLPLALLQISFHACYQQLVQFFTRKTGSAEDARSRTSPNLSLMFKPQPWLTAYATYIEGLEQGGVAPLTASNSLAVMPPMVSRQKELGVKAEAGGLLWSAALFQIDKTYEYTNAQNVYGQDGTQRHRGIELSTVGKPSAARLPSFVTLDAGVRYAMQLAGKPLSLRLAVSNLADRDHWLNSYYLGAPRSVAFSAQMAF